MSVVLWGENFFIVQEVTPVVNPIYNVVCIQLDIHRELLLHYTDIPLKGTLYLTPLPPLSFPTESTCGTHIWNAQTEALKNLRCLSG